MFDATLNGGLAAALVFAVAFAESLIIVGFFVPGWMLLLAAGGLVGTGHWPFWPVLIAAYMGAVLGEMLGFWLGRHNSARVRDSRFLARHADLLARSEALFQRWGAGSLVVGRFIGPVRALLPFVAGVLHFPWRIYLPLNLLTALIWAPAYLLPGMLAGASTQVSLWQLLPFCAALLSAAGFACGAWRWRKSHPNIAMACGLAALLSLTSLAFLPGRAVLLEWLRAVLALMR